MSIFTDCRNPVLPPEYHIADPEAHVMPDSHVYVYGSWDQSPESYCSREYLVISTEDMINWTGHGTSFQSSGVPWANDPDANRYPVTDWDFTSPTPGLLEVLSGIPVIGKMPVKLKKMILKAAGKKIDIAKATPEQDILYAPDAICKEGKYYLYFCLSNFSEGVAVSDHPEGPFDQAKQLRCGGIDPAVFIDDDGQAYYFWGQFRASGAKLSEDMTELLEETIVKGVVTEEEHGFHEGSSIRKRNGIYYFVYPCIKRGRPTALAYATASNPLGPYEYKGIIIDNTSCDPGSWNIHGSIEEVNGQWYVFYHRSTGNSRYMRRMCVEPIYFGEDGSIKEVKMTSQGAGRPFGLNEEMQGYRACELSGGLYVEDTRLMHISDDDEAYFRYVDWEIAPQNVRVKASGSGKIRFFSDGSDIGTVYIKDGEVISSELNAAAGLHEILLKFCETKDFSLDAVSFS